jgi:hypothetical protein
MSVVNGRGDSQCSTDDGRWSARAGLAVLLHRAGDGALRRPVDQALIRGLGTAFRVFVSGLVLCLEGGRRAEPGRVALLHGSDQQPGEVRSAHPHSWEANILRPPELQHTVQRRDSDGHLGCLKPSGPLYVELIGLGRSRAALQSLSAAIKDLSASGILKGNPRDFRIGPRLIEVNSWTATRFRLSVPR